MIRTFSCNIFYIFFNPPKQLVIFFPLSHFSYLKIVRYLKFLFSFHFPSSESLVAADTQRDIYSHSACDNVRFGR
jgi:hypothetical protein